jgi:hypothetical protein
MTKRKGYSPNFVISDEVSGTSVAKVNQAIDMTEGKVKNAVKRLAISWNADDILQAHYAVQQGVRCKCKVMPEVTVHPDVAYALAAKSPSSESSVQGVTAMAAQHGGKLPLYALGKVLGPWDMLIEELRPRLRG